jgi:hypothetical protein
MIILWIQKITSLKVIVIDSVLNVLLIEGDEKYHYAWIKNYDRLLSYNNHITKVFCPHCCYGFQKNRNGKENLRKHKVKCEAYGPQRTTLPKEGKIGFTS